MTRTQGAGLRVLAGVALFFVLLSANSQAQVDSQIPSSEQLEAEHARIGEIRIVNNNVFETDMPEENNSFFRLANRLHIKTRAATIQQQLLFKSGDVFVERLLRESERVLRSNRYLFDA
ncbi:MAG TPA: hypothetical protein VET48_13025, partial [Steroidobacteraceae bacterium]|nr:hypothetical protein [Steroidobacteraceae bacterium]